ncbi:MAG: hypothetical protein WCV88_01180 [Patescibacteria group bacterium]
MEAIFLALIQQLNSAVFVLVLILILTFWLAYKSGGWVKAYKDFEGKSDKFDVKIDAINSNIAKIQATSDLLYQAHLSTIKSHSPISLTTKGAEIAQAISAEVKVNNHWTDIKQAVESKAPTNPYDIQTVALDVAGNNFDKIFTLDEQNEIKTHAFSIGMNMLEIYPILGLIIRDRIFQERGIALHEVDDHTTKK